MTLKTINTTVYDASVKMQTHINSKSFIAKFFRKYNNNNIKNNDRVMISHLIPLERNIYNLY